MTLPNFLIVGAAKAGTTALYRYLSQHPQLFMPETVKETFFFCGLAADQFPGPGGHYARHAVAEWEQYRALFANTATYQARGEACVAYLYFYHAALPRILDRLGDQVRIVISLRNPVERAYSNYLHHVRDGLEPLGFEDALAAAARRKEEGWWWGFQYVDVGRYYAQVRAYLDAFGRARVHLVRYEDLVADPTRVLRALFRFLEVYSAFVPDTSGRFNVSGIPRSRILHTLLTKPHPLTAALRSWLPPRRRRRISSALTTWNLARPLMRPETRQYLQKFFREDVLKVETLLQQDLSDWLNEE